MNRAWLLRLHGWLFAALFLAVLGSLGWLSLRYSASWQWSGGTHALSEPSVRLLERLQGPVAATAFVSPEHTLLQRHLRDLLAEYAARKPDFKVQMVNPDAEPDLVRAFGVQAPGEIVLEYSGRRERVTSPTEARVSAALERMLRGDEPFVAFSVGHGERDLRGGASHDLGIYGEALQRKGYRLLPLSLAESGAVPSNTALLVLASPARDWLPGERRALLDYLQAGGNLLWLAEPDALAPMSFLSEALGLSWREGVVVDPASRDMLAVDDPRLVLVTRYEHPAAGRLQQPTVFPIAAALRTLGGDWQAEPLLATAGGQAMAEDYRPGQALPAAGGPLLLGAALSRERAGREQRVVVIGDGDFLSNRYRGNGDNLQLGLNLIDWLSHSDRLQDSYAHSAPDQLLQLSRGQVLGLGLGFLLVLPLGCLLLGGWQWWRRRSG